MNRRLFVLASLALGGCATAPPPTIEAREPPTLEAPKPPTLEARAPMAELEPIYSAVASRAALTIRVASNGCATAPAFTFYVERRSGAATVAFARRGLARCRASVMTQQELAFTWAELGIDPGTQVFLLNPLVAWTGPGS